MRRATAPKQSYELLFDVQRIKQESFEKGKKAGYSEGDKQGFDRGYDEGYAVGDTEGYEKGYGEGETAGYNSGNADGYAKGNAEGYAKGYEVALEKSEAIISKTITTYENDKITNVGAYSFYGCTQLKKAHLPNLENCGDYAFSKTNIEVIDYPELASVGSYAFSDNASVKTANLPKATKISGSAFRTDSTLETVDLGSATSIGNMAFYFCKGLRTLIIRTNSVCTIGTNNFSATHIEKGTGFIYVPDDLVDGYKAATNWSTYASQIKPISELE